MKIENQVCTLEQAKRLTEFEIGKDATTLFVYVPPFPVFNDSLRLCLFSEFESRLKNSILSDDVKALVGYYPAYTVAELGVMLPDTYDKFFKGNKTFQLLYCRHYETGKHHVWSENVDGNIVIQKIADTEAEARAEMLIYLLEEEITTADEVNERLTPKTNP